jgi:hypothetical protein
MSESVKQITNKKIIWYMGHPDDDKEGITILNIQKNKHKKHS